MPEETQEVPVPTIETPVETPVEEAPVEETPTEMPVEETPEEEVTIDRSSVAMNQPSGGFAPETPARNQ